MTGARARRAGLACAALLAACGALERGREPSADAGERACEVKVILAPDRFAQVAETFGLADARVSRRTEWFFDTPALALAASGVVLRARERQGEPDDATVKLRPMDEARIEPAWRALRGFKCESDLAGERAETACSLDAVTAPGAIDAVGRRARPPAELFDANQRRFLAAYAPIAIPWTALEPLGPVDASVWHFAAAGWDGKLGLELWRLPGGAELLEISTRVPESEAEQARAELIAYLHGRGLETSAAQATKTRMALEALRGR